MRIGLAVTDTVVIPTDANGDPLEPVLVPGCLIGQGPLNYGQVRCGNTDPTLQALSQLPLVDPNNPSADNPNVYAQTASSSGSSKWWLLGGVLAAFLFMGKK